MQSNGQNKSSGMPRCRCKQIALLDRHDATLSPPMAEISLQHVSQWPCLGGPWSQGCDWPLNLQKLRPLYLGIGMALSCLADSQGTRCNPAPLGLALRGWKSGGSVDKKVRVEEEGRVVRHRDCGLWGTKHGPFGAAQRHTGTFLGKPRSKLSAIPRCFLFRVRRPSPSLSPPLSPLLMAAREGVRELARV